MSSAKSSGEREERESAFSRKEMRSAAVSGLLCHGEWMELMAVRIGE